MYLSNIPKKNENYIELTNTKIDGFPSNNINSSHFTIIFTIICKKKWGIASVVVVNVVLLYYDVIQQ